MTFKLHPLHSIERHADVIKQQGVLGYHKWLEEKRGTGRSTALALRYIAQAIENPHTAVLLLDHVHTSVATEAAKRSFAMRVADLAKDCGLAELWTQQRNGGYFLIFGDDSK